MFFLRDSMMGRRMSSNVVSPCSVTEPSSESCSPMPSGQIFSKEGETCALESANNKEVENEPSFQILSSTSEQKNKRKRSEPDISNVDLVAIEKEKVEIEREKVQLLIEDNQRREAEDNDADRHFLLSLLPLLRRVPEEKKTSMKIRVQEILHEGVFLGKDDSLELCSTRKEDNSSMIGDIYRPWLN